MYTDITLWPNQQLAPVSSINELQLINVSDCYNGITCLVKNLGSLFYYSKTSTLTPDNVAVISPVGGIGRWLFVKQSNVFQPITVTATDTTTNCSVGSLYYVSGTGSNSTFILPQTFNPNDKITIINQVTTNSVIIKPYYVSQKIINGASTTTSTINAAVTSAVIGSVITLTGVVSNTTWFVYSTGTITYS